MRVHQTSAGPSPDPVTERQFLVFLSPLPPLPLVLSCTPPTPTLRTTPITSPHLTMASTILSRPFASLIVPTHRTRGRLGRRRTRAETRSYRRRAGDNLYGGHSRHEVRPHSSLPSTASLTFPDQNRRRCVCRFQSVLERPPRAASAAGPRRPGDGQDRQTLPVRRGGDYVRPCFPFLLFTCCHCVHPRFPAVTADSHTTAVQRGSRRSRGLGRCQKVAALDAVGRSGQRRRAWPVHSCFGDGA